MSSLVITKKLRRGIVGSASAVLIAAVVSISAIGNSSLVARDDEISSAVNSGNSGNSGNGSESAGDSFALFDGGEASFADFAGKPLLINFWASWCPACVAELPEIQAVHEQFGDQVTILGLANADQRSAAQSLADEVGLTYVLGDDPEGELFRSLSLIAMPSSIFVTADGQIQEVFGGQLNESALVDRINNLLEES